MDQARGDVDVAGHEGPRLQRLRSSSDGFGHLYGVHAARELVGNKDDGLGRGIEHHFHLAAVADHGVHVGGEEHGHDKVNVGQGVAHRDGFDDVLQHRLAAFACAVVYDVEAVGARSVIAAVVFQEEELAGRADRGV